MSQKLYDLPFFREAAFRLIFGKNQFLVRFDVIDTTIPSDELNIVSQFFFYFFRQTGGIGIIVSALAVGYRDYHNI